jgi:hypothetical protein
VRWTVSPQQRRPNPEPLQTDDRLAVLIGTCVWVLLGVGGLVRRSALDAAGDGWWLWVCLAAVALGIVGLAHLHRQQTRRR